MESNWKQEPLEEITELIVDCPHSTPKWTDSGVIVLRNQNIRNGKLDLSSPSYTDEEGYQKRIKRAIPRKDDLVFTREAPMGEVCIIPNGIKCCLGQRMVLLRANKQMVDAKFLLYEMQSSNLKHQISWNEGTGTTVSNIRIPNIKAFQINVPPLKEQKRIAHILGSLDDKIELNRQMNQTLEQMSQVMFKSWFVDFDPVIDNALAAGNPIPEELRTKAEKRKALGKDRKALPEEIQKLFPDEFEYSEELEKWMPKGWRVASFASIAEVKYGKDHKKLEEGNIPVYGSGGIMRYVNQSLHSGESVLIPRKGTLSNLMYVNEEFWSVDTMFFSILKMEKHAKYLYYNLKLLNFNEMNVGSAVPSMTTKVLNSLNFILPQTDLVEAFDAYIQNLYNKIEANKTQIISLTKTRDTLLPKLISGEVRVPEIKKMLE